MTKKRILIVDDSMFMRNNIKRIIEQGGHIVCGEAANGHEAILQYEILNPDIVTLDVTMPVMDGLEATKCIRTLGKADSRTVPIIAMTANAFDEDMKKSIDSGMNGHLSKPIDINKLYKVLQEILCQCGDCI